VRPRRLRLPVALLVATTALVCALPAAAKDGVKATLTSDLPLDAERGTRLRVAWTLAYVDDGRRRLFGAGGVFVRLVSASGAAAETAFAREDRGRYTATVTVPEGGIGDVEVGLRGWVSGEVERRPSDMLFPITNDPVPGVLRVASPPPNHPSAERSARGERTWVFVVAAGLLLAVGVAVAVVARRVPRRAPAVQAGSEPVEKRSPNRGQTPLKKRSRDVHDTVMKDA
jgi:hypothetical protein